MIKRNIGDEVKFQEWHYGKVTGINGNLVTIVTTSGTTVIKNSSELRTNKQLPKYIDFFANRYRVRIKGELIGYYMTVEEAIKARDEKMEKSK